MSDWLQKLAAENQALRESRQAMVVRERVVIPAGAIIAIEIAEASGQKRAGYRVAKVGQCDKLNQNHRVYPAREWRLNVELANTSSIPAGKLIGAVDHAGPLAGGNLKDSALLWKKLEIQADGSVAGEFVVIDAHSRGRDLKAQMDAGMAIGFSTVSMATGRRPTEAERAEYGIAEEDDLAVILQDMRLKKIDAVDDPSVIDAWTRESTAHVDSEFEPEKPMKTLAELKERYPELFALHERAIADAVARVQAQLDAQAQSATEQKQKIAELEAKAAECASAARKAIELRAYLAESIRKLAEHGVEIPFREVAAKEAAEKIDALGKAAQAKDEQIAALQAQFQKAQKEASDLQAAAADSARRAELKAKTDQLLKDHPYAAPIRKAVEMAQVSRDFDVKALAALIQSKTEEYEAVAQAAGSRPELGISGYTHLPEEPEESAEEPLPIASELAESL